MPSAVAEHLRVAASFLTAMHACISRNDKRQHLAILFPPACPQLRDAELSAKARGSSESAFEKLSSWS